MPAVAAPALADRIDAALPQQQCRRCGYDACHPYAEAVARGEAINRCPPGGDAVIVELAALTGRPVVALEPECGAHAPLAVARVDEDWCIGCTLCIDACPVDAIIGAAKRMHTVLPSLCTGCELCIPPCPVDCIVMVSAGRRWSREDARAARVRFESRQLRPAAHGRQAIRSAAARRRDRTRRTRRRCRAQPQEGGDRRGARTRAVAARTRRRHPLMQRISRRPLIAIALAMTLATCAATTNAADNSGFAAELDSQWNYDNPAASEQRFRAELANWPKSEPRSLEVATQIARAQGLQRRFADAHATLDTVEKGLDGMPAHVRVRYLLERGRAFNSGGAPERAVPLFALALSLADCADDSFYAIDAAHMLGIAAPAAERLDWNMQALAMAEKASDARSKRWLGPLYNNIGYTYQERSNFATALAYYRQALPAYEARGEPGGIRNAKWMIARAQRSLGELDAAEAAQRALLAEYDKLGEPDGYVYEELAEISLARGDAAAAGPWAAKAWTALAADAAMRESEPARLARLAKLGGIDPMRGKP